MLVRMRKMEKAKKMGERRNRPVRNSMSAISKEPSNKTAFRHETSTTPVIGGIQPESYHPVPPSLALTFDTTEPKDKGCTSESGSQLGWSAARRKAKAR